MFSLSLSPKQFFNYDARLQGAYGLGRTTGLSASNRSVTSLTQCNCVKTLQRTSIDKIKSKYSIRAFFFSITRKVGIG